VAASCQITVRYVGRYITRICTPLSAFAYGYTYAVPLGTTVLLNCSVLLIESVPHYLLYILLCRDHAMLDVSIPII